MHMKKKMKHTCMIQENKIYHENKLCLHSTCNTIFVILYMAEWTLENTAVALFTNNDVIKKSVCINYHGTTWPKKHETILYRIIFAEVEHVLLI